MSVKDQMQERHMTNVDMILALREKGIVVAPPMMSNVLNEVDVTPRAKEILKACEEILNDTDTD